MPFEELQLGDQTIRHDRVATAAAYRTVTRGGAKRCDCLNCRNFKPQREVAYPDSFKSLLEQLGVDFKKEGAVYMAGPVEDGYYVYESCFYFIGEMITAGESTISGTAPHQLACYFTEMFPKPEDSHRIRGVCGRNLDAAACTSAGR